jgi:sugar/nucleoside kinase (ribokinase family)
MTHTSHDVLGIGNAIVDVIAHADEAFLARRGLVKGTMRIVGAAEADLLYSEMGPGVEMSGGSVANTVAGVASLGGRAAYIGRIRDDLLGRVCPRRRRGRAPRAASSSSPPTRSAP